MCLWITTWQFGPQNIISTNAVGAQSVFSADLDGDGDIDVLSASFWDDKIAWYENLHGEDSTSTSDTQFIMYTGVNHHINFSPNPASSTVTIDVSLDEAYDLQLIDEHGRLVMGFSNQNTRPIVLDISNLKAGVYFVRVSAQGGFVSQEKLVVE
jgi:hypothetical protein